MSESVREAFEKWWKEIRDNESPQSSDASYAWAGYQAALADKQEPVGHVCVEFLDEEVSGATIFKRQRIGSVPLYTSPQTRKLTDDLPLYGDNDLPLEPTRKLTDDEIIEMSDKCLKMKGGRGMHRINLARAIEAKLREG